MDLISELPELAFASRLKRLSEQLMRDVNRIYQNLQVPFEARWFTLLYTLNQHSPMRITALAAVLRVTHTAINQSVAEMKEAGLASTSKNKEDERQCLVRITSYGKEVARKLEPVWQEIFDVTRELINCSGCDLLSGLREIENELKESSLYERVCLRLNGAYPGEIVIRPYSAKAKKYFKSLNVEWLNEYFTVEQTDLAILNDPRNKIIKPGGAILFACIGAEYAGTCALIRHPHDIFEAAKMAVSARYRGRGIGHLLMDAIIDKAKESGAQALYLRTNAALKAANHLYRKFGFRKIRQHPFRDDDYARSTYVMKLDL